LCRACTRNVPGDLPAVVGPELPLVGHGLGAIARQRGQLIKLLLSCHLLGVEVGLVFLEPTPVQILVILLGSSVPELIACQATLIAKLVLG
jgi:hypothetical protein